MDGVGGRTSSGWRYVECFGAPQSAADVVSLRKSFKMPSNNPCDNQKNLEQVGIIESEPCPRTNRSDYSDVGGGVIAWCAPYRIRWAKFQSISPKGDYTAIRL